MALFRGKCLAFLQRAEEKAELRLPSEGEGRDFQKRLSKLYRTKWNVHLQARYSHGEGVVKYLGRYVRGGALKNGQIRRVTEDRITYRFYAHGEEKPTEMTLAPEAFLHRYLQHVPEHRRCVVRSYGLYAPTKTARLDTARAFQPQPPFERPAFLSWQAYYRRLIGRHDATTCPTCGRPLLARAAFPRKAKDPPGTSVSVPIAYCLRASHRPCHGLPCARSGHSALVASPDALFVLFAPMGYTYSEPTVVREALVSFDRGRPTAFKVHSSGRG